MMICARPSCSNNAGVFKIGKHMHDKWCVDCMKIKKPDAKIDYVIKYDCIEESKIIYASSMQHEVNMLNSEINSYTQKKLKMLKKINKNTETPIKDDYTEFLYLDAYITKYYKIN